MLRGTGEWSRPSRALQAGICSPSGITAQLLPPPRHSWLLPHTQKLTARAPPSTWWWCPGGSWRSLWPILSIHSRYHCEPASPRQYVYVPCQEKGGSRAKWSPDALFPNSRDSIPPDAAQGPVPLSSCWLPQQAAFLPQIFSLAYPQWTGVCGAMS